MTQITPDTEANRNIHSKLFLKGQNCPKSVILIELILQTVLKMFYFYFFQGDISDVTSSVEVSRLREEVEVLRSELHRAEIELEDRCWQAPTGK